MRGACSAYRFTPWIQGGLGGVDHGGEAVLDVAEVAAGLLAMPSTVVMAVYQETASPGILIGLAPSCALDVRRHAPPPQRQRLVEQRLVVEKDRDLDQAVDGAQVPVAARSGAPDR